MVGIGGVLALSALLVGCRGTVPGAAGSPGGDAVTVVATDLAFQPKEIRVAASQRVTVRLQNKGKLLHDWTVEQVPVSAVETRDSDNHPMGGGIMSGGGMMSGGVGSAALHVASNAGQTAEVTFVPGQAGEFTFYCSVPGHRQAGMEGRLIVE